MNSYFMKCSIKALSLLLSLIIITLTIALHSKASEDLSIAIIQEDILLSEAEVIKDLNLRLTEMIEKNQSEFSNQKNLLTKLEQDLKEEQNNIPPGNTKLAKVFEKKLIEFNRLLKNTQEDFKLRKTNIEKLQKDSMKKIKTEITIILSEMSKELHFKFVMPSHQLIWFDPRSDITQDVLKRTNIKLKKLNF